MFAGSWLILEFPLEALNFMVLRSFGGNSIFVFSALYRSVFMLCKFSTSMRGESRFWSPKPFNFGETNLDAWRARRV